MKHLRSFFLICGLFAALGAATAAAGNDARNIVKAAVDHWRGDSSRGAVTMTIHRPDWERSMSLRSWTRGTDDSLVRVTKPKRDAGNGTLVLGDSMWTYSPKVNRVIKIPASMMNQNWLGSDFSNRDISRTDDIVDSYDHRLLETSRHDGRTVYVIESIPHEDAAVVWGKEVVAIRDDNIILRQDFYDQAGILVKSLATLQIGRHGGRTVPVRQRMTKAEADGEWTEIQIHEMEFDVSLSNALFTRANLKNPRE